MQRQLSCSVMPKLPEEEEEEVVETKTEKAPAVRLAKERSIHLIPLLTFLCFLLLFLRSHDPSPSDMLSFGGNVGEKVGNRKLMMF